MAVTQKMVRDKKPSAWDQFPDHLSVITISGEVRVGIASQDGQLQAEYTLNNVKRLKAQPPILEDAD